MKRILTLIFVLSFGGYYQLNAQCSYSYSLVGNTVVFNFNDALSPFFTIDSVVFNFGDGFSETKINIPPSSSFSFILPHAYAASGTYSACMTEYTSWGGSPQFPCTSCQNIAAGSGSACFATANFTTSINNLNVYFTNISYCTSCISSAFSWNFGDGTPVIVANSPNHIYTASGTYMVCLMMEGTNAAFETCLDTFCYAVTVLQSSVNCSISADFSSTLIGNSVTFTNSSNCTNCSNVSYLWGFGDGTYSTLMNPVHAYNSGGTFNACLFTTGVSSSANMCQDTICKPIVIVAAGICDVNKLSLSVFPNPATNKVTVNLPKNTRSREIHLLA